MVCSIFLQMIIVVLLDEDILGRFDEKMLNSLHQRKIKYNQKFLNNNGGTYFPRLLYNTYNSEENTILFFYIFKASKTLVFGIFQNKMKLSQICTKDDIFNLKITHLLISKGCLKFPF